MNTLRDLTELESSILKKLTAASFRGSEEIRNQLASCQARPTEDIDNYGSVYLETKSKEKARVITRVPVEGATMDADDIPVSILLHVVDGFVNELEIFKADGSPLKQPVDVASLRTTINKD